MSKTIASHDKTDRQVRAGKHSKRTTRAHSLPICCALGSCWGKRWEEPKQAQGAYCSASDYQKRSCHCCRLHGGWTGRHCASGCGAESAVHTALHLALQHNSNHPASGVQEEGRVTTHQPYPKPPAARPCCDPLVLMCAALARVKASTPHKAS